MGQKCTAFVDRARRRQQTRKEYKERPIPMSEFQKETL